MNQKDRRVLELFAAKVRHYHPEASIWAFGSRTRDEAAPESDLDICVVIKELDQKAERLICDSERTTEKCLKSTPQGPMKSSNMPGSS